MRCLKKLNSLRLQLGRSNPELMGGLGGSLVPSVNNFKAKKKIKGKGQHHPGMTVAEIDLQRATVETSGKEEEKPGKGDEEEEVPHSSVLTSLGDLVRNVSNTVPFFM